MRDIINVNNVNYNIVRLLDVAQRATFAVNVSRILAKGTL